jgi:flagellar basal-body rod protein FlgG
MNQLQQQMDIVSHNMSNTDTIGFKKREASFSELLYQQIDNQPVKKDEVGRTTPMGIRQGTGAKLGQAELSLKQGSLKNTGRSLDFAFTKENQFFKILGQDGAKQELQFTREGAFYLTPAPNNTLRLVNGSGQALLDENNQPITFSADANSYKIKDNGVLEVSGTNGYNATFNLGVVAVDKPQFLEQKGDNAFALPKNMNQLKVNASDIYRDLVGGASRNDIGIEQNELEQSNVDIAKEMTDLINMQRSYQFQSRSITIADQMMGLVNSVR